jgi:NTP pyrophosphatase (non-canonical NTP hydrolase)
MIPRQPVQDFALDMERMLQENDFKGGWQDEDLEDMIDKLAEEKKELVIATRNFEANHYSLNPPNEKLRQKVIDEAADVGNIAMMISDIVKVK